MFCMDFLDFWGLVVNVAWCGRCKKPFTRYSKSNKVCSKCYKESHQGGYTGSKHQWKKLLDLQNEI